MAQLEASLQTRLGNLPGAMVLRCHPDGYWMLAPELDVQAMATLMNGLEARLSTVSGIALENGETAIIYHYALGRVAVNLRAETRNGQINSITPITPAADWIEREIHDLYSVEFTGHPNLARLIRPPEISQGFFRENK